MDLKTKICNYAFLLCHLNQLLSKEIALPLQFSDISGKEEILQLLRDCDRIVNQIQNIAETARKTGEI